MQRLLDADAAIDMLRWENSECSIVASVRIALIDRDVPSYFQGLEHLRRYCARPPFALERLSVRRGEDGRIARALRAPPTQGGQLGWPGPLVKIHSAVGQWRRRALAIRFSGQALGARAATAEAPAPPADLKQPRGFRPESQPQTSRHGP